MVYYAQRDFAKAEAKLLEVLDIDPRFARARGKLILKNGWNGFWRKYLELCDPQEEDAFGKAIIALRFGDKQQALSLLEKSFEERSTALTRIKTDPQLDPLRDEPRFQILLRRAGHSV